MKKASERMRPEYDFSGGVRGKYSASFRKGTNVVVLEPDIARFFSDSAAVNDALRVLVQIAKRSRRPKRQATRAL
jgi:primosomal protein N'